MPDLEERPQRRREWTGALFGLGAPLALLAGVVAVVWLIAARGGAGHAQGEGVASGAVQQGKPAPDFALRDLEGRTVHLSDFRGQPVIVNFWASWCTPCRDEVPHLVTTYQQHKADGLVVVGVDLQEDDATVRSFAREFGMDYPVLLDPHGQTIRPYRITGPPTSVLIDRGGTVRGVVLGPMQESDLAHWLAEIGLPQRAAIALEGLQ
jgi:peroxiredoxin